MKETLGQVDLPVLTCAYATTEQQQPVVGCSYTNRQTCILVYEIFNLIGAFKESQIRPSHFVEPICSMEKFLVAIADSVITCHASSSVLEDLFILCNS